MACVPTNGPYLQTLDELDWPDAGPTIKQMLPTGQTMDCPKRGWCVSVDMFSTTMTVLSSFSTPASVEAEAASDRGSPGPVAFHPKPGNELLEVF